MEKIILILVIALMGTAQLVSAGETLKDSLKEGKFFIDTRYRYEHVNQNGLADESNASTVRTRFGYKTGEFYNTMILLEGENVAEVGDDTYNNTINGKGTHPVVADVKGTELNQAFMKFTGIENTEIKGGRQVITVDNHRFIGHVGWRQNNQSFDGATIINKSLDDTILKYGYIYHVNRIFGNNSLSGDWDSDSHFFNFSNSSLSIGKITTYGYLLDFTSDSPANSNQTYGFRLDGKVKLNEEENITLKYHGEFAYQQDFAKNTTDYGTNYYHIAPAIVWEGITGTVGYEVLGSDNSRFGFRSPLATLHKFNGWADVFLTTPATGLEDFYVDLAYKISGIDNNFNFLNGVLIKGQFHDFSPEDGGGDYGTEWGVYLKKSLNEYLTADVKYSNYDSDGFATDREKVTFGLAFKY